MMIRTTAAAIALATTPGCVVVAADRTLTFDDVEGIVLDFSNGDVTVVGEDAATTTVNLDMGGVTFREVGHEVDDGVLLLKLDCGVACGGDVTVTAPRDAWIEVDLRNGDLSVRDLRGDLNAELGAGDFTATGLEGENVCAAVGAGDVQVETLVPAANLIADLAAGDVGIRVPAGAYALDLDAGAGRIDILDVVDDPASPFYLSSHLGAGDLTVLGF